MRMENDHGVKEMRHEREVPNKLLARGVSFGYITKHEQPRSFQIKPNLHHSF